MYLENYEKSLLESNLEDYDVLLRVVHNSTREKRRRK